MRPNATPAKDFYKQDATQAVIESSKFTLKGRLRAYIGDLCDFCLKSVYLYRDKIGLRRHGYKFGCDDCHKKGAFKWKNEGGDGKVLLAFKHSSVRDTVKKMGDPINRK